MCRPATLARLYSGADGRASLVHGGLELRLRQEEAGPETLGWVQ